jgi:beta-barrel assembly-enhancing protease
VKLRILVAGLVLAAAAALGQNLPDLGDVSQTELSPAQERRLGESIMREIRADRSYSDDPEVTDYLNALGYRLTSASPEPAQQFQFFLILDPQVNAFALPGGFIGVNSGLLLTAQAESEVASVLGHEIAHVTQHHIARMLVQQKQSTVGSLAGLAIALLASRVSSQAGQAAMIASQAGAIQSMLNFTRSNEQEADRVGFQILERAGYDPHAMPVFFERLQRATRIYETSAPAYLRTHPLTYERVADMEARAENVPYRQVPDSLEFQLMRAKLRAGLDTPQESVAFFEDSLREKKYLSEAASRYGLVTALIRAKSYARAKEELAALRKTVHATPIVEALAGQLYNAAGDFAAAQQVYRTALQDYPGYRALIYDYADLMLRTRQPEAALKLVEGRLQFSRSDYRLYQLQARAYAALDKRTLQHRAQAEAYYRQGNLQGAVEQLALAQKAGDGDFYLQSSVDARIRELRAQLNEERREQQGKK